MHPDLVRAVYHLAADWHSGQWPRGYRLLCHAYNYALRHGIDLDRQTRASRKLYRQLERRYAHNL